MDSQVTQALLKNIRISLALSMLTVVLVVPSGSADGPSVPVWRLADGSTIATGANFTPPRVVETGRLNVPQSTEKYSATVGVEVVVGMNGGAAAIAILAADRPELIAPALAAAEASTFEPATLDGKPVAVRFELRFAHRAE